MGGPCAASRTRRDAAAGHRADSATTKNTAPTARRRGGGPITGAVAPPKRIAPCAPPAPRTAGRASRAINKYTAPPRRRRWLPALTHESRKNTALAARRLGGAPISRPTKASHSAPRRRPGAPRDRGPRPLTAPNGGRPPSPLEEAGGCTEEAGGGAWHSAATMRAAASPKLSAGELLPGAGPGGTARPLPSYPCPQTSPFSSTAAVLHVQDPGMEKTQHGPRLLPPPRRSRGDAALPSDCYALDSMERTVGRDRGVVHSGTCRPLSAENRR